MTNINWPLMIETLDFIHKNPKSWDQSDWACGTQRCIAGHAAFFAGMVPDGFVILDGGTIAPLDSAEKKENGGYRWSTGGASFTQITHVSEVAGILGLEEDPEEEEVSLFSGENTWGDVMDMVEGWAAEDGVELPKEWRQ